MTTPYRSRNTVTSLHGSPAIQSPKPRKTDDLKQALKVLEAEASSMDNPGVAPHFQTETQMLTPTASAQPGDGGQAWYPRSQPKDLEPSYSSASEEEQARLHDKHTYQGDFLTPSMIPYSISGPLIDQTRLQATDSQSSASGAQVNTPHGRSGTSVHKKK